MIQNPRAFLALTFATPLLLAGDWQGERAEFRPEVGASLSKTIEIEGDLGLEEMKLLVGGQDVTSMIGQMEMSMKHRQKLVVEDTYVAVGEGRPQRLERSFEEISSNTVSSGSTMVGDQESDMSFESELEGSKVVFTWEDGEYTVVFAEGEKGDEKLLEGLVEDIDLRRFLAPGEVEEGESWKIEGGAVKELLLPGGDLKLRPTEGSAAMPGMETMNFSPSDMLSELEGTFEATFAGTRSENGAKVAVIRLALDGSSANDLTERMQSMTEEVAKQTGASMEITSFDGEWEYEAEGELLWNLGSGLLHGLTLSGELRMIMDISMSMSMEGNSRDMEMSQTYAGTQTITLTTGN